MKKLGILVITGLILFVSVNNLFAWGGWSHKRMTYWAWKHAGLSNYYGYAQVTVKWDLDSIQNTLGLESADLMGYFLLLLGAATGATFSTDTTDTVPSVSDSALFTEWARIPDEFDKGSETVEGANIAHMYIPGGIGFADGCCQFFFNKAVHEYNTGNKPDNKRRAYAYLALASHYLEDCGFPPHNEKNYLNPKADSWQAKHHSKCEDWIGASTIWFNNFDAYCDSCTRSAIPACDPVMATHGLAWDCIYDDQKFKDAWSSEAKYQDDWDDTLIWAKELKVKKPKTVEIVKRNISRIQPRLIGLFLAFKNATK